MTVPIRLAAAGTVALVAAIAAWSIGGEPPDAAERRLTIANMTGAEQSQLRRRYEDFQRLSASERDAIRQMHAAVEQDPALQRTLLEYDAFVSRLDPWDQAELRQLDPAERIRRVERLTADRLDGPADLAVEVISNESVSCDRGDKFYEYQEGGVREYWIIDPRPGKERVDGYWLTPENRFQAILPDAEGCYHSTVLPDFWFRSEWLWQTPTPDPLLKLAEIAPHVIRDALRDSLGM